MTNRKNTQSDHTLHVGDWLHIALANWKWFVLSLVVCMGASFWYIKRSPDIYSRSASVLIKDETRGAQLPNAASAFSEMDLLNIQSTVDNEVLIFKSKRLMIEVARKLKLDIFYSVKGKFRDWDLYTTSPVTLTFPEALETSSFSFKVTPLNDKEVLLSDFPEMEGVKPVEQMKVHLNDTVATPVGKLVVTPTLYYTQDYYQVPVTVNKMNLEKVGMAYNAALQSMVASKTSSIIHLSISDVSPRRAEDILNTLIDVYNQDAIDDKNRIAVNTANFINERLIVIEQELGGVESQIADYKSQHNLADISTQTGSFMERSNRYQQEGVTLENQRTLALYIRDYLADPAKSGELIPSNTGISDGTIERQIMEYNELMLQRDKLIGNSSNKNPVVMDMNNSLASMKQTIVRTVDNLIAGLDMKIQNIRGEEERAMKRIAAVPSQQKYVLSVERQQKIKESLYIYLLNKREENALTKSITESNARIIDPAMGSSVPVSPKTHLIMLAGFMLGLLLPACVLFVLRTSDTKVRGKKDLTDVLSIPFLGEIPRRERERRRKPVGGGHGRGQGCRIGSVPHLAYEHGIYERGGGWKAADADGYLVSCGRRKNVCLFQPCHDAGTGRIQGGAGGPGYPEGDVEQAHGRLSASGSHELPGRDGRPGGRLADAFGLPREPESGMQGTRTAESVGTVAECAAERPDTSPQGEV